MFKTLFTGFGYKLNDNTVSISLTVTTGYEPYS